MSSAAVFSATTLTGVDQAADRFGRFDIQMSVVPTPPPRSEPNHSVRPSAEIAALVSNAAEFTSVTAVGGSNCNSGLFRRATQTSPLPLTRSVVK